MPRPRIYIDNAQKQAAYRHRKRRRQPVYFRSKSDEWETPASLFAEMDAEFHFTIDVAALPHNTKYSQFYTPGEDGLIQEWQGVCWLNPPYSALRQWMAKALASAQAGATVVCLVPARTDTTWWHDSVQGHAEIRFLRGRVKFSGSENSAPFPSALLVFRPAAPVLP